jgi:hypothetical protein
MSSMHLSCISVINQDHVLYTDVTGCSMCGCLVTTVVSVCSRIRFMVRGISDAGLAGGTLFLIRSYREFMCCFCVL